MLTKMVFGLCVVNVVGAIVNKNWYALCGWVVACLGWLVIIMQLS